MSGVNAILDDVRLGVGDSAERGDHGRPTVHDIQAMPGAQNTVSCVRIAPDTACFNGGLD